MAYTTTVVIGTVNDGDTGSSASTTLSKKIADLISGNDVVEIAITRQGLYVIAVVVTGTKA